MTMEPRFKGYTIDCQLQEFRPMEVGHEGQREHVPFESRVGQQLCAEVIDILYGELADAYEQIATLRQHQECDDEEIADLQGWLHDLTCRGGTTV